MIDSNLPPMVSMERAVQEPALDQVAEIFLVEWRQAHGTQQGTAHASLSGRLLTILIENALHDAELELAQRPYGQDLIQRYVEQLMEQVYPQLASRIEEVLHGYMDSSQVTVDGAAGRVVFTVQLR